MYIYIDCFGVDVKCYDLLNLFLLLYYVLCYEISYYLYDYLLILYSFLGS